jgi:hypothetical protein
MLLTLLASALRAVSLVQPEPEGSALRSLSDELRGLESASPR